MCVSIYGYVHKSEDAYEGQKWALDALGLEVQCPCWELNLGSPY